MIFSKVIIWFITVVIKSTTNCMIHLSQISRNKIQQKLGLLFLAFLVSCNNHHHSKKTKRNNIVLETPSNVSITDNQQEGFPLNPNLFGFNTAYLYQDMLIENQGVLQKIADLQPSLLRFPGGTVANYYHPEGAGFGFRDDEMAFKEKMREIKQKQKKRTYDAQNDAIKICRSTNAKIIYVANILTGTPEEAIKVLDKFKRNHVEVVGVELGNELYFKEYRKEIPDVEAYIAKCKPFANMLREKFPTVKIGVLSPKYKDGNKKDQNTLFYNDWNQKLSQETFYDAVISHYYVDSKSCQTGKTKEDVFNCSLSTFNIEDRTLLSNIRQHLKGWYNNKEIWLTEYNINKPHEYFGNTMTQTFLLGEYLFGMASNAKGVMPYTIGTVHQLASEVAPFSMIYLKNGQAETTVSYDLYQLFGNIAKKSVIVKEIKNCGGGFSYMLAENTQDKTKILLYMNKSNTEVNINFGNHASCVNNYIKGAYLWASKDNIVSKTSNVSVALPISFGVIEYN